MNGEPGREFAFAAPVPVAFGRGLARDIASQVAALAPQADHVLLVHDPALHATAGATADSLGSAGLAVDTFDDFAAEPRDTDVDRAAGRLAGAGAGCVVGLGGGSALDVAKLAACVAAGTRACADYALSRRAMPPGRPTLLLPSTAGTGAEMTRTAIFTGSDGRKRWAWDAHLRAGRVVLDPELTVGLPRTVTLHTGLDALVHAIEACTGRRRNPFCDALCLHAVRTIVRALPRALDSPGDLDARGDMLVAAAQAGIAIDHCGTGLAHAFGHALGGLAGVAHGRAVALSLLATAAWSGEATPARYAAVVNALGAGAGTGIASALHAFIDPLGLDTALPGGLDPRALAALAAAPEQAPMRENGARLPDDAELASLAAAVLSLPVSARADVQTPPRQR